MGKKNQNVLKEIVLRKRRFGNWRAEIDSYKSVHTHVHSEMTLCFENAS